MRQATEALDVSYPPNIRAGTLFAAVGTAGIAASASPGLDVLLFPAAGCVGLGMGLTITSFTVVTQDRVPWKRRGAATALLLFSRNVGGTIVVSAMGLVMAVLLERGLAGIPNAPAPEQVVDPERWESLPPEALEAARGALRQALVVVFGVAAVSAAIAFVVAWRFPRVRIGDRPEAEDACGTVNSLSK